MYADPPFERSHVKRRPAGRGHAEDAGPHSRTGHAWVPIVVSYAVGGAPVFLLIGLSRLGVSKLTLLLLAHQGPVALIASARGTLNPGSALFLALYGAAAALPVVGCIARPSLFWILPLAPMISLWLLMGLACATIGV